MEKLRGGRARCCIFCCFYGFPFLYSAVIIAKHQFCNYNYREHLKTSVFGCFCTLGENCRFCNSFCHKELAVFSEEPLKTPIGFLEVPYILSLRRPGL
jgi:hypothetical protein